MRNLLLVIALAVLGLIWTAERFSAAKLAAELARLRQLAATLRVNEIETGVLGRQRLQHRLSDPTVSGGRSSP